MRSLSYTTYLTLDLLLRADSFCSALPKLVNVLIFPVLLSACWEFFADRLLSLRSSFAGQARLLDEPSFSGELLRAAVMCDSFELSRFPHALVVLFASSFHVGQSAFYNNFSPADIEHLVLHFLLDYVVCPTYVRGFVVAELSVAMLGIDARRSRAEQLAAVIARLAARGRELQTLPDTRAELHDCEYFMDEFTEANLMEMIAAAGSEIPIVGVVEWTLDDARLRGTGGRRD
jgi:hypothetical protein